MSTPPFAAPAGTVAPALRKVRPAFVAQAGLVGSALVVYALVLVQGGLHHQDLDAYLTAGRAIWHGQPLYAPFLHHPLPDTALRPAYIYPPAFALLVALEDERIRVDQWHPQIVIGRGHECDLVVSDRYASR